MKITNSNTTVADICFASNIGKYTEEKKEKLKGLSVGHLSDYVYRSPKVEFSEPKPRS